MRLDVAIPRKDLEANATSVFVRQVETREAWIVVMFLIGVRLHHDATLYLLVARLAGKRCVRLLVVLNGLNDGLRLPVRQVDGARRLIRAVFLIALSAGSASFALLALSSGRRGRGVWRRRRSRLRRRRDDVALSRCRVDHLAVLTRVNGPRSVGEDCLIHDGGQRV